MDTDELTGEIIGAALEVSNTLGAGFLEKVYERALVRELTIRGVKVRSQIKFPVIYKAHPVGDYIADLLVNDEILVELKCVDSFSDDHLAMCLNYLRASRLHLALLINFQKPRVEWKRIIL